ncbi:unnamed protein product [Bursaphelenchus okinawaensis]|uniref:Major facilitator superfamily (MFS) profile domain-containing protein n=1 Tax=Bursaphelenchus okinawaensis TaxID=465554 RepID=A0A811LMW6_9BILA|nr:unnamed protein product [Bursaphelenchus okinawaensis]CAG9124488.1 unnamed protein product [Bursaphelenchus okinawaensis]
MEPPITPLTKVKLISIGALVSFSSIFQMGYSNAYVNTAIDGFKTFINQSMTDRELEVTSESFTWIWATFLNSWFPGFAIGAWLAVPLTDSFGRKLGLLVGNITVTLSVLLMTLGPVFDYMECLILGRFFSAVGSGISMCALVLFLQEIAPNSMRGTLGFFAETAFVAMNALGAVAGMSFMLGNYITILVGSAMIPGIISFLVVLPLKETPKFLMIKKDDLNKAVEAVQFYQNIDDHQAEEVLSRIRAESSEASGSIVHVLKSPALRKGLVLGVLALQITTSIWPVVFLSTEFMVRTNITPELAEYVSSGMLILSTLSTCTGMVLVEKCSRRKLFLSASFTNITALLLFVICSQGQLYQDELKYGCILAICLHGTSYSVATGPIAWFLVSELVPTEVRSICSSVALALNHISAVVVTFLVLPLYDHISSYSLLILFVIPSYLCLVTLYFYLPETKDRDIAEIVRELEGHEEEIELK